MDRLRSLRFPALFTGATSQPLAVAGASVTYCLIVLYCFNAYVKSGSSLFMSGAFVFALAPLGVYLALRWPLAFPFCLYVLFLPFESLSSLGKVGSLEKMLGLLSAFAILLRVLRHKGSVSPPRAAFTWLALLAYMALSIVWAISPNSSFGNFQEYASNIALFALLSVVRIKRWEFNSILGAAVVAGIASAGYDAYLFRNNQDVIAVGAGASRVVVQLGDAIIDPNALAAALILPFAIALYWLFNSRLRALRLLMIPALFILLLGFAASGSRGGLVDLAAVFAYLIIRSRHRLWLAALMTFSTVVALIANPGLPARFAAAQQDGAAGRSDIWHIGVYAFRDYWFVGAGVGNFADAYDREYIHVYSHQVLGWHWAAHNVPLTIATELGVVGFAIFAAAVITQCTSLRGYWLHPPLSELRLALEAATIGVLFAGLSLSSLHDKYVWLAFSMMPLMRAYQLSTADAATLPRATKERAMQRRRGWPAFGAPSR